MSDVTTTERTIDVVLPEPVSLPPTALEVLTRSEIDVAIATARRYPRSLALFKQMALTMIRLDQETASACFWSLPRKQRQEDGSYKRVNLEGPSVRLAEIAQIAYRNMRAGARIIAETDREVVAQGWAHDVESNVAIVTETRRRIVDRNGRRYSDDMMVQTANAACSIAMRNAIFRVIPRAFINPLVEVAKKVAAGDAKTLTEGRQRALAAFAEFGISAAAVCDKLERRGIEDIDLEDLTLLGGLLTAIREKETSVEAEFPSAAGSGESKLAETLRRRRGVDAAADAGGRGNEPPGSVPPAPPPPDAKPPSTPDTAA